MMNLNRLRVFRHVYETTSVSEAARALNLTQPPVTRMLRAYEEDVGFKLFTRGRGRLVPTPEADLLYRDVVAVFDGLDALER
ncbi:MAG: LysR family transcriptional regulator, partial [Hyphomicrobiaceae bacterium]